MSVSHEDIRYKVLRRLRDTILKSIDRIRSTRPQAYSFLQAQLEEYRDLIEKEEDIPLIVKNEKIIEGVGRPDVEVFGGRILIEVKVKLSEFTSGFSRLSDYAKFYPYAEYAIITNYQDWEFYAVENGTLASAAGIDLNNIVEAVMSKGVRVSLSTGNVRNMFSPVILLEDELYRVFQTYEERDEALFKAYRNIMNRLYESASEEEIERLFIKHTLIQMIVSACLTASSKKPTTPMKACSGADVEIEIVLPYLNWWDRLIGKEPVVIDNQFLRSLLESVYSRALLLNWDAGMKEDIFRELYEILIDAETRRKIGEYYTPLWLVEYMTQQLSEDWGSLKGKVILDPFCGSGTFLVIAFYKKVQEGEDPDDAIKEVIGFDINPLAVSIARAELLIAYQTKRKGVTTPLVFNTDSAGLLIRSEATEESKSFLDELKELEKRIGYAGSPIYGTTEVDFSEILKIEMILRNCFREAAQSEDVKKELVVKLGELRNVEWRGALTSLIVETLASKKSVKAISQLIERYGNGVWAVSITSLFAPYIIYKVKVDTVMTNPPWAQLTEPKGTYGKIIRDKARQLLKDYEKTGQILTGSDISSVLLYGSINIARSKVAFLMPKEVVYSANSFHGLGKILTYDIMADYQGKIVEVNVDAFQHGRIPSIVFLEKEKGRIVCNSLNVKWKGTYSKAMHLSEMECSIEGGEDYGNYIEKVMVYANTTSKSVKEKLHVKEVFPMGNYVRGLFGGEKKKGAKKYAGLVFDIGEDYDRTAGQYTVKLSGTKTPIKIPKYFIEPYWKKLVYRGQVFPFHLNGVYDVLLSSEGEDNLKRFLENRIMSNALEEDKTKIRLLIEELRQPKRLMMLEKDTYYLVYRCTRNFASLVLTVEDLQRISENQAFGIVIESHCSFMSLDNESEAHYYSSILNYMASKVIEKEGAFERDQFLRPLVAILHSNLEWKGRGWQSNVSELGKRLHQEAPRCFKGMIRRGMRVEECFEKLRTCPETKALVESLLQTVDEHIDKRKFLESLELVCKLRG